MLQGVVNISKNIEHSDVKKDYRLNGKHRAYLDQESSNDLIQISPAFKFLTKLNWKVQTINVNEKDKIVICFSIKEFEFRTSIDLNVLPLLKKVYFDVRKKYEIKKINLVFSVPLTITENENLEHLSLNTLEILFSRLEYLTRKREIDSSEKVISYGLYEDLVIELKTEFQKILYALFVFVEKLTSQKMMERLINMNINGSYETIRLENVEVR